MAAELILVASGLAGAVCASLAAPVDAGWIGGRGGSLKHRLKALAGDLPGQGRKAVGLAVIASLMTGSAAMAYAARPTSAPARHPAPVPATVAVVVAQNTPPAAPAFAARPAARPVQASPTPVTDEALPPTKVQLLPAIQASVTLNQCPPTASSKFIPGGASVSCYDLTTGNPVAAVPVVLPVQGGATPYISTKACISVRPGQVATLAVQDGAPGSGIKAGDCYDAATLQPIEKTVVNYGLPPGLAPGGQALGVMTAAPNRGGQGPNSASAAP